MLRLPALVRFDVDVDAACVRPSLVPSHLGLDPLDRPRPHAEVAGNLQDAPSPFSSAFLMLASVLVAILGRPRVSPLARARLRPALTRLTIMARSNSAKMPIWNMALPAGVEVSSLSTDGQSVENQRCELLAVAERRSWDVVHEFSDQGISGAKDRDKRPAFDRMLKGATRREFDMIAAWSVDRLGRSLQHLMAFLGEVHASGVDLYLHQQIPWRGSLRA